MSALAPDSSGNSSIVLPKNPDALREKEKLNLGPAAIDDINLLVDASGIKLKCDAELTGERQPYGAQFPRVGASIFLDDRVLAEAFIDNLDVKLNKYDLKLDLGLAPAISESDLPGILESLKKVVSGSKQPVRAGFNKIYLQLPGNVTYDWIKLVVGELKVCTWGNIIVQSGSFFLSAIIYDGF